jgi:hypothetical protein
MGNDPRWCRDYLIIKKSGYRKVLCNEDWADFITEETVGSGIYKIQPTRRRRLSLIFWSNWDSDVGTGFQLKLFAQRDTTTATTAITATTTCGIQPSFECGIVPSASGRIVGMHTPL